MLWLSRFWTFYQKLYQKNHVCIVICLVGHLISWLCFDPLLIALCFLRTIMGNCTSLCEVACTTVVYSPNTIYFSMMNIRIWLTFTNNIYINYTFYKYIFYIITLDTLYMYLFFFFFPFLFLSHLLFLSAILEVELPTGNLI